MKKDAKNKPTSQFIQIDDAEKYKDSYIISGEILEDGEFIYDKPIRSNHYKKFKIEDESENDMEEDSETEI